MLKSLLRAVGFVFGVVWVGANFWLLMAITSGLDHSMIEFLGR